MSYEMLVTVEVCIVTRTIPIETCAGGDGLSDKGIQVRHDGSDVIRAMLRSSW